MLASVARRRAPTMLLRLRNVPILEALRMEEALFRADKRSWLITNEWDGEGANRILDRQWTGETTSDTDEDKERPRKG